MRKHEAVYSAHCFFSARAALFANLSTREQNPLSKMAIAGMMLLLHLPEDEIGGLSPTVGNIAVAVGAELGYSAESQKTVESPLRSFT